MDMTAGAMRGILIRNQKGGMTMIQTVQMKIIARIHSDFDEKFGIPRQSGLVDSLRAKIVFEPEFRAAEAVRGLEGFSHVWLIWQFSQAVYPYHRKLQSFF